MSVVLISVLVVFMIFIFRVALLFNVMRFVAAVVVNNASLKNKTC